MKIYISGAISGRRREEYLAQFNNACEKLKKEGFAVINPAAILDPMPKDTTHKEYMKLCFTMLDMCDAIYMLKGWENSRGANQEYGYAWARDYVIMEE